MKKELCILIVEDSAPDTALINHALRKAGMRFRARRVESRDAFLRELERRPPDVILSDHGVPGFDSFTALAETRRHRLDVPFIFVTGAPGQLPEENLKSGADDFILKDSLHLLAPAIERALRGADARRRHRKLEAALTAAEEHLHLLVAEVKHCATFMLDAEGRVASWNPAAERMLGCEPNEILREDCGKIFSGDEIEGALQQSEASLPPLRDAARGEGQGEGLLFKDASSPRPSPPAPPGGEGARSPQDETPNPARPNSLRRLRETAAREGRAEAACTCVRKGGEPFRARVVVLPLRGGLGTARRFVCIVHDLTGRGTDETRLHQDNEARRHAAQWESAHREMERFTHAIAMDLRAPLRHIESFSELLNKGAGDALDPKNRGYLKTISQAAHHMSRLINDLFTYSRIGQAEMHRLHLNLPELVKEVVHDLRHETEKRDIEWVIGDLPEVMADPVMLWMVLTNLIANALKFTRPCPNARIEIGSAAAPGEVVVFVRDNGVGFDMHHAHRLFGVFRRLHGKEFEGTGVGLANVRRIIQRHGGRTWAEGAEHEGATFYFSLPGM